MRRDDFPAGKSPCVRNARSVVGASEVSMDIAATTFFPPQSANRASILTELARTEFRELFSQIRYHVCLMDRQNPALVAEPGYCRVANCGGGKGYRLVY